MIRLNGKSGTPDKSTSLKISIRKEYREKLDIIYNELGISRSAIIREGLGDRIDKYMAQIERTHINIEPMKTCPLCHACMSLVDGWWKCICNYSEVDKR